MKKFKKYSEGLYKAYKNAEVTEYPGIHEYRFSYDKVDYLLITAKVKNITRFKFGKVDPNTRYLIKNNYMLLDTDEKDIDGVARNILNYHIKYVLADDEIMNEVIDDAIKTFGETVNV